jgi:transcriptional regulator with XRE-family HTH domain
MPTPAHGTLTRYKKLLCRCTACRGAAAAYQRHRTRMQAYGRWQPLVDAEPARLHVRALMAAGLGWERIARLAGVPKTTVASLLYGLGGRPASKRIRPQTADALLAVTAELDAMAGRRPVDGTGTRRRLRALVALGWPQAELARRMGMSAGPLGDILKGRRVFASTARAAAALYRELAEADPLQHGVTAPYAAIAARRAIARGWLPPIWWDEDTIDDPRFVPATAGVLRHLAVAEDAKFLAACGITKQELIAERLGLRKGTLTKYLSKAGVHQADLGAAS